MNVSAVAVKICGLTTDAQADAIAAMGAKAIGVIGVAATPRFIPEQQRRELFAHLHHRHPSVDRVWVVADLDDAQLNEALGGEGTPTVVQLHGNETPERCSTLRLRHPQTRWWKALRLRQPEDLDCLQRYDACVDALLLDAWSAEQLGGTGHRLDLSWLQQLERQLPSAMPWWLAGGISAEWIPDLLSQVRPDGLDASSRLETAPGVKDLTKVRDLIEATAVQQI